MNHLKLRQIIKEEIFKTLNEGYLDTFARNITKKALDIIKDYYTDETDKYYSYEEFTLGEYNVNNNDITVFMAIKNSKQLAGVKGFTVTGALRSYRETHNSSYLALYPKVNINIPPDYQKIYMDILTVTRHELEHMVQSNKNNPASKYREDPEVGREGEKQYTMDKTDYSLIPSELEANAKAAYLLAKKQRIPFKDAAFNVFKMMKFSNAKADKAVNDLIKYIDSKKNINIKTNG
jgi:hypothetical protein